jgi:hypothetical protein
LHSNCLATLANIAPYLDGLHPYASHRLVKLFELLTKKYKRILAKRIPNSDNVSIQIENPTGETSDNANTDFYHHMYNVGNVPCSVNILVV